MKTLAQNKILVILAAAVLVVFFVLILLIILPSKSSPVMQVSLQATPIPIPTDTSINYSNFNKLTPGKSTLNDVEKINGAPSRISTVGDKTYLYYPTPVKGFENKVLIRYGVVIYAVENVFANYRGYYDSYTKPFGSPDFAMYSTDGFDYPWYVFLTSGLAVQSSGNYITGIIYFSPQNKTNFINNISSDIGLSEQEPLGNQ